MSDANVVARWRDRGLALGRLGWRCGGCGKVALVRRRLCAGCGAEPGASAEGPARAALPAGGTVAAASAAGAAVEHLDQITGRKASVWVELDGGGALACLLAHADSVSLMGEIRGARVRLAIRRLALGEVALGEPIPYGIKAALSLETRAELKAKIAAAKAAPPAAPAPTAVAGASKDPKES